MNEINRRKKERINLLSFRDRLFHTLRTTISQQRYKSTAPIHLLQVLYLPLCSWFLSFLLAHTSICCLYLSLTLVRCCARLCPKVSFYCYLFVNCIQIVCSSKLCALVSLLHRLCQYNNVGIVFLSECACTCDMLVSTVSSACILFTAHRNFIVVNWLTVNQTSTHSFVVFFFYTRRSIVVFDLYMRFTNTHTYERFNSQFNGTLVVVLKIMSHTVLCLFFNSLI